MKIINNFQSGSSIVIQPKFKNPQAAPGFVSFAVAVINLKELFFFLLLSLLSISYGYAQTTALSFSTVSNDFLRPGSGAANWNDGFVVPIPAGGATGMTAGIDRYCRFGWNQVQNDDGSYNWTAFDTRVQIAINAGQKFSFGIMPICEGCGGSNVGGTPLTFPLFLHTQMQAESVQDWASSDMWIPNWNSPSFLTAWQNMLNAVASHIASTSYNGVAYKNVINYVDIRGYGNFGEWHNYPYNSSMPSNLWPTSATLQAIINSHISAFPNYPLVILIGAYDNVDATTKIPLDVIYYALTAKNNWGPIGWRRDNWGDATNYTAILENNSGSLNGLSFKTAIMSRYQTAPVTGEPLNGLSSYSDMTNEVKKYGASSFGNGNIANASSSSVISDIQAASKAAGANLQMTSGSISSTIPSGGSFSLTLNWQNIGAAPSYENWNTVFELRSGSTVAASWTSSFKPKLFLPGSTSVTDNLTVPSTVAAGSYGLYVIIRDPNGYRKPMPLSNSGAGSDGSYLIKNVTVSSGGSSPIINVGTDLTITLPTNSVTLTATLTDLLSTLSGSTWTQVSGPNTATIASPTTLKTTVSGMIAGVYTFQIKIIDLLGLSATASVKVTVKPAPNASSSAAALVANAGPARIVLLPKDTVYLDGTKSYDPGGPIAGYAWTQLSGPATDPLNYANTSTPAISGLKAGEYNFQLTVTGVSGATATSQVKIIGTSFPPNQAPVANAGTNQTILQSTGSFSLYGTRSADYDGTITDYRWSQVSGPTQTVLTDSSNVTPVVYNPSVGTYIYRLTVTDDAGATDADTVKVTVQASADGMPIANAGSNKTITLPLDSVSLNGTSSSNADGSTSSYEWSELSGPSIADLGSFSDSWIRVYHLQEGVYYFQLKVTDDFGNIANDTVRVTVRNRVQHPYANAGNNQTIVLPANSVKLNGTASWDFNSKITAYSWTQISGPAQAVIGSPDNISSTVSGLAQGDYIFQLTVTDSSGASGSDLVSITVYPAPTPQISNAVSDISGLNGLGDINSSSPATSQDQLLANGSMTLYPNPAASVVNLRLITDSTGKMTITIYDMTGKMVMLTEMDKSQKSIDQPFNISSLAHGMYFIRVTIGKGKSTTSKFLKQ